MERFDYYGIVPRGMDAYMASHGRHFSKPMLEWAVGLMRSRGGSKVEPPRRGELEAALRENGAALEETRGAYDAVYVWCMGRADYFGSSVPDEAHLAKFVKDYIDDPDGYPTRAFDEFYMKTIAKGIDIPWEDVI